MANDRRDAEVAGAPHPRSPRAGAGRPRRPARVVWIVLLALVVLFVVVDRIAVRVAERHVVSWIQSSQKLPSKPEVHIFGFPFLTQAAFGEYRDVEASVRGLSTPGPRVERMAAHLKGAHIPLAAVLRNQVNRIPVDRASAAVFVTYADLNSFLRNQPGSVQVHPEGDALRITSRDFPASLSARVTVESDGFTIVPTAVDLDGFDLPVPDEVQGAVKSPLPVPLRDLPFNLRPASLKVHKENVELTATADNVVLEPPQS